MKKEAEDKERIIILVKTPQVVEALIDEGILLDKVILGGMGQSQAAGNLIAMYQQVKKKSSVCSAS